MTSLIVSPSAVLRNVLRTVLHQVSKSAACLETGSSLQVERLLAEKRPQVVLWDETLGEGTEAMIQRAVTDHAFHLVLLVSPSSPGSRIENRPYLTVMEKVDFATVSVDSYAAKHVPLLTDLFQALENKNRTTPPVSGATGEVTLVVIGASTGGPTAIRIVLEGLPEAFPCPIALVQHIDTGYESGFAEWLNQNTRLNVRLARDGDEVLPGEVIVAPTERHLVCREGRFYLDDGPKIFSQKPAIDRLFTTAASFHKEGLVGILLTGMGMDGAQGCKEILLRGGQTLVQDEATSTVWGMPKAAVELDAASLVLPLEDIGPRLLEVVRERSAG